MRSDQKPKRTKEQQALFERVAAMWAAAKGWPTGRWPSRQRYDAILIGIWVCKLGMPFEWWSTVVAATPKSAAFTWLTTEPQPGRVCRLEEWAVNELQRRENARQRQLGNHPVNPEAAARVREAIDALRRNMSMWDET